MSGWLVGAGLVLIALVVFAWRARKADTARRAIDLADPWLEAHGFAADRVRFSAYTQPALVQRKGATVLVGVGPRQGAECGFIIEINSDGSCQGAVLDTNSASWHRSIAVKAMDAGLPLFTMMLRRARQHQLDQAGISSSTARDQFMVDAGMPPSPNRPDVTGSKPTGVWRAGDFLLLLLTNPRTVAEAMGHAGPFPITYDFTLVVVDISSRKPRMFISLERSMFGSCCIGVFERDGSHHNLGSTEPMDPRAFVNQAVRVFRDRTGFHGQIQWLGREN